MGAFLFNTLPADLRESAQSAGNLRKLRAITR